MKSSHIVALKSTIASSELIITNTAFLLHDLKKHFVRKESAVMAPIYSKLDLLVIDKIDFCSPRSLALLLSMIMLLSRTTEK